MKKILLLALLSFSSLGFPAFSGAHDSSSFESDSKIQKFAFLFVATIMQQAFLHLQVKPTSQRETILTPVEQTTLSVEAYDHGGDGWCGHSSLAATLGLSLSEMLNAVIAFLNQMSSEQSTQLEFLIELQHTVNNSQYQNINTAADFIGMLLKLKEKAEEQEAQGTPLPEINFWMDELLLIIYEAALHVHIVVAQQVTAPLTSSIPTLLHSENQTQYSLTHPLVNNSLFSPPLNSPIVALSYGGNFGHLLAHYQSLTINGHTQITPNNAPLFYSWLQHFILEPAAGISTVSTLAQNAHSLSWSLTGSLWQDTLHPQDNYWQRTFEKKGLEYIKKNKQPKKNNLYLSKKELAKYFFLFLTRKDYERTRNELRFLLRALEEALNSTDEGKRFWDTKDEIEKMLPDLYFKTLSSFFDLNQSIINIFESLVDKLVVTGAQKKYSFYLDTMQGVGGILRANEEIPAGVIVGEYVGDLSLTRRSPVENPFEDMYIATLLPGGHLSDDNPLGCEFVVSALKRGNEFRWMSSSYFHSCNVMIKPVAKWKKIYKKGEEFYSPIIQLKTTRNIKKGQQLICYYGFQYLKDIKQSGCSLVPFCAGCFEALPNSKVKKCVIKTEKCTARYCNTECRERDEKHAERCYQCLYFDGFDCVETHIGREEFDREEKY